MIKTDGVIASSFRDPSGFVFSCNNSIYRQVNKIYREEYDHLMESGLYEALVNSGLLVRHEEVDITCARTDAAYKVLRPEQVKFISYPYEWCFSQLKDAALLTLEVQKKAFDFGMTLKDASAYNIQFINGKPVFIDTISFEKYREGKPWVAYRQFCQHFLAPLSLMAYRDIRLNQLLRVHIDGIPLDLASRLLPFWTRFRFSMLVHIHLHAGSQRHFADKNVDVSGRKMSRLAFTGFMESLEKAICKLKWQPKGTEWAEYYESTNYSTPAMDHKKELVDKYLERVNPKIVWDLGANMGIFSIIAAEKGAQTIAFDVDPSAVEKNYLECRQKGLTRVLPLVLDLTNPSPGVGWQNDERVSLLDRGPVDTVLALALIHHLAISNNLPLDRIASFMSKVCDNLIIEFVPKNDSQVQRLLSTREDIFPDYRQGAFEDSFGRYFPIRHSEALKDSERTLYLFRKRTTTNV